MPLTKAAQAIIDEMVVANLPPLESMQADEARALMNAVMKTPPEDQDAINSIENRNIPGPAGELAVRIYKSDGPSLRPGLVHFHGGGWVLGDLDTHDGYCRRLANFSECAVIAVDYRIAPDARYPAAVDDCYGAVEWVAQHGTQIGVDKTRLGVVGDSAGGNIAAAVSLMARDRGGPKLKVQLLAYPAVDATMANTTIKEFTDGPFLTEAAMIWFWDHYLGDTGRTAPYVSPLFADSLEDLPPALIITAEADPLRGEGEAYAGALKAAGNEVVAQRCAGMFHAFLGMAAALPEGMQAIHAQADFARRQFGL